MNYHRLNAGCLWFAGYASDTIVTTRSEDMRSDAIWPRRGGTVPFAARVQYDYADLNPSDDEPMAVAEWSIRSVVFLVTFLSTQKSDTPSVVGTYREPRL